MQVVTGTIKIKSNKRFCVILIDKRTKQEKAASTKAWDERKVCLEHGIIVSILDSNTDLS